jgi:hypothetical protein
LKNVATERSFLNVNGTKQAVGYGAGGSSRADVILKNADGTVKQIFDLKTGRATLSTRQINNYIKNVPGITKPSQITPIR